jgi:hypothetical protein
MRVIPVADGQGERQARQEAFQPRLGPVDILSADQDGYVDSVPTMQQKYARDPNYNGRDAEKRFEGDDGG